MEVLRPGVHFEELKSPRAYVTVFTVMLVIGANLTIGESLICVDIVNEVLQFCFGFCALILIYVVGIADDLIGVRYRAKFIVQTLSALLIVASGLYIDDMHGLMYLHSLPPIVGYVLTLVVIVFITNSINLIDGIMWAGELLPPN